MSRAGVLLLLATLILAGAAPAMAQQPDWAAVEGETSRAGTCGT